MEMFNIPYLFDLFGLMILSYFSNCTLTGSVQINSVYIAR